MYYDMGKKKQLQFKPFRNRSCDSGTKLYSKCGVQYKWYTTIETIIFWYMQIKHSVKAQYSLAGSSDFRLTQLLC